MQKLTTCFCFNNESEEAVNFYASIFKDLKVTGKSICGENEPSGPAGDVRTVAFQMLGQDFLAINGGPYFKFTEAMSMAIGCDTQDEIDRLWNKLSAGGKTSQCGWLHDKFGVPWQIVPSSLGKWMSDPDQKKSQRVMQAVLKMTKLDIATMQAAYEGK